MVLVLWRIIGPSGAPGLAASPARSPRASTRPGWLGSASPGCRGLHPPGRRRAALGHHQGHQAHRRPLLNTIATIPASRTHPAHGLRLLVLLTQPRSVATGRSLMPPKAARAVGPPEGAAAPMNQSRQAHHSAQPLHVPRGIQPRTLRTHGRPVHEATRRPPVTALSNRAAHQKPRPGRHDPSACRERGYDVHGPRDQ
jgi:hypothetical protein